MVRGALLCPLSRIILPKFDVGVRLGSDEKRACSNAWNASKRNCVVMLSRIRVFWIAVKKQADGLIPEEPLLEIAYFPRPMLMPALKRFRESTALRFGAAIVITTSAWGRAYHPCLLCFVTATPHCV
jgi:hypothetical protein